MNNNRRQRVYPEWPPWCLLWKEHFWLEVCSFLPVENHIDQFLYSLRDNCSESEKHSTLTFEISFVFTCPNSFQVFIWKSFGELLTLNYFYIFLCFQSEFRRHYFITHSVNIMFLDKHVIWIGCRLEQWRLNQLMKDWIHESVSGRFTWKRLQYASHGWWDQSKTRHAHGNWQRQ